MQDPGPVWVTHVLASSMRLGAAWVNIGLLITPRRNRLQEDIVEATECLKAWWDAGMIRQLI
jgi:hypothetical protein